ncbi:MAG TPA: hypothetical protein VGQ83_12695 [Polyangia bacterium]|jgi:hypothetical protein
MVERRSPRRHYKDTALQSWLAAVCERTRAAELVLADAAGLLVAGGQHRGAAEELAAEAARHPRAPAGAPLRITPAATAVVRALTWDDEDLLLIATGEGACAMAALEEAPAGIRRILA